MRGQHRSPEEPTEKANRLVPYLIDAVNCGEVDARAAGGLVKLCGVARGRTGWRCGRNACTPRLIGKMEL